MSTYIEKTGRTSIWPLLALMGVAAAAVLTAVGTFWDVTNNEEADNHSLGDYLPVLGIIAVGTIIVFGLVVRTASGSAAGTRSLALAIVGLLSSVVFWSGLPAVFAAGAVACALAAREHTGRMPKKCVAALGISAVTIGLAVAAAIGG